MRRKKGDFGSGFLGNSYNSFGYISTFSSGYNKYLLSQSPLQGLLSAFGGLYPNISQRGSRFSERIMVTSLVGHCSFQVLANSNCNQLGYSLEAM